MSALRTVHRASTWNSSDYICLCCRQRLLAQRQQKRASSSETTTTATSDEIDDDWFSNFNGLSTEPLAKKDEDVKDKPTFTPFSGRRPTRRQRMAAGSFSTLKSSLSSSLGTSPVAEATQDHSDRQSGQSDSSPSYQPYQPFLQSSSAAPPGLHPKPRSAIRKTSPRRGSRGRAAVDVYQPNPSAPAALSAARPRDPKLEAVIQELSAKWSVKTVQMLQDLQRTREQAKTPDNPDGSKVHQTSAGAMHSQPQPEPGASAQHSLWRAYPRKDNESATYRFADMENSYPAYRSLPMHSPLDKDVARTVIAESADPAPSATNASLNTEDPNPETAASSVEAEVLETAEQIMPHATMSSFLVDLTKTGSEINKSEEERSQEPEEDSRAPTRDSGVRRYSSGLNPLIRKLLLQKDDEAEPHSRSGTRAMSSMAQKATELVTGLNSKNHAILPWDVEVGKTNSNVNKESFLTDASQTLATLHPKAKAPDPKGVKAKLSQTNATKAKAKAKATKAKAKGTKAKVTKSEATKAEATAAQAVKAEAAKAIATKAKATKASRVSASGASKGEKKSVGVLSSHGSKKDAESQKGQTRRERSRQVFRKLMYSTEKVEKVLRPGAAVRNLLISKQLVDRPLISKHLGDSTPLTSNHSVGETLVAESEPAKHAATRRERLSTRATKSRTTKASISVDVKDRGDGKTSPESNLLPLALSALDASDVVSIDASDLEITPVDITQPLVPGLQHGLDRVLFNPGVFQLQDPHSRVYNFDPYLQKIMPVVEFDYNALKQYKTSSQDTPLSDLAKQHGKRYIGSTSSMTGTLGHFHYLISSFRPLNLKMLSRSFPDSLTTFTQINRAPNAIFLRNKGDGIYAIDADKEFDGPNVLMMLGKSMEKLLTLPKADYERYKKEHSHLVTEEERSAPEAFQYTTMGDFLMRSQLDAHDSRLPGTGMFDLKTRAVLSIRMNAADYEPMTGYEIQTLQGRFQSYEREYYDMMRSTLLKYMLQVRMGRMDGIFLAYHNVERIFGFQYMPLHEMDHAVHSQTDRCLGDQEFKLSLDLLNKVLDKATRKFPDSSLRFHFEAVEEKAGDGTPTTMMWVFAVPVSEDEINRIQSGAYERTAEFERTMMGIEQEEKSVENVSESSVENEVHESEETPTGRSHVELAVLPDNDSSSTPNEEAPATTEDAAYSSTATDAAPIFTGTLETHEGRELQPLFAASIVCKSRINGSAQTRPEKLKPDDKWELEHLLHEWDTSELMWSRYEDVKSRRKAIFDKLRTENEDDNAGHEDGVDKKKKGYVDFLKSMSQQGRLRRDRINELEAGKEPVVVGQPFGKVEEDGEKIDGLDDYLGWLYCTDAPNARES